MGEADYCVASEGFFSTLGIPLLSGRLFDSRDTKNSLHVAVVSKSLADEKWPNQNPIGQTVEFGNMDGDPRLLTIVGVVGDMRDRSLEIRSASHDLCGLPPATNGRATVHDCHARSGQA